MAYIDPLDPTTPSDADPVSSGDDEIRKLKRALIERFATIIEDLDTDPLVLKSTVFPTPTPAITPGLVADRPNPPDAEFTQYYAYDSDQLFVARDSTTAPGSLEWVEAKKTQISEPIILAYSAGESRFAPEGTETRAQRVRSAIAAARLGTSPIKVVYVPKSLWGYGGDPDYGSSMFDSTILLVREGAMPGWYDPVAYGADITGTTNSTSSIDICFLHASTSSFGMRLVAFTAAGDYLMTTDVDQRGCALFLGPGVTLTGGGNLTGDLSFKIPADAYVPPADPWKAFTYNANAVSGSRVAAVTIAKMLAVKLSGNMDSSGRITLVLTEFGTDPSYNVNNLITITALVYNQQFETGSGHSPIFSIDTGTNSITFDSEGDAGSGVVTWGIWMTFSA